MSAEPQPITRPSGLSAASEGKVLAFGHGSLPRSADAETSVLDVFSQRTVLVSAGESVLERTFTVAWWQGNEVAVWPRAGGLTVFGSEWASTKSMPGFVDVDAQTGNFRADIDGDELFDDVQTTTDRFLTETDSGRFIGASLVPTGSSRTVSASLRTTDPIPTPRALQFQLEDGSDRAAVHGERFVWTRGAGTLRDVPVDIWYEDQSGWSWITFRPRRIAGVTGQGIIGTVADVSANPIRAAWVPTGTVTVTGAIERRWSNQLPSYLPQGAYGSVDGTVFSMSPTSDPETIELRTWGPYAPRSRHFHYSGSFGWETVPVSTVESRVEVRTTASLAGHLVSLSQPASEIASSARVAVVGQGAAPDDLVLADGHRPTVTVRDDGSWGTSVGRFHLDDLKVEFV